MVRVCALTVAAATGAVGTTIAVRDVPVIRAGLRIGVFDFMLGRRGRMAMTIAVPDRIGDSEQDVVQPRPSLSASDFK